MWLTNDVTTKTLSGSEVLLSYSTNMDYYTMY